MVNRVTKALSVQGQPLGCILLARPVLPGHGGGGWGLHNISDGSRAAAPRPRHVTRGIRPSRRASYVSEGSGVVVT